MEFKEGKLFAKVPGQPTYALEPLGGRRYKFAPPAPNGFFVTFRPNKDNPKKAEALLEQPQGNVVISKKDATIEYKAPLSVEELLQKAVEAMGGESNIRKVKSVTIWTQMVAENQGFNANTTQYYKSPNLFAEVTELRAIGKKIGQTREYFNGKSGGTEASFVPTSIKREEELAEAERSHLLYSVLEAKRLFKEIIITGIEKVNEEETYVVEKKPEKGMPVREFFSTKTFRLLKSVIKGNTLTYHDFRKVGNLLIPFRTYITSPDEGHLVSTILKVKLDEALADSLFAATPKAESATP